MDASDRGATNQARGEQTESILKGYHLESHHRRVAHLDKVPTPTAVVKGKVIYATKSTVDFIGYMMDGSARFVAEEVKSFFEVGSFAMSRVKPHQRAYLDGVHASGGVAVLTIVDRIWQVYVCPWELVRARASLSYEDLREFRVRPPTYLSRFVATPRT